MPPEYVHFFPHCLHWRLNPVRQPSGLRISPVMASSPWHEQRGTVLDKTLSMARWRNKCNWWSDALLSEFEENFPARLQLFLYALPRHTQTIGISNRPAGSSKTESVKRKRRIRSWWPSANRP